MSKVRAYCITFFKKPCGLPEKVRYAIHGHEVCPTTQKEHWQSYVELETPMRIAALKKAFNDQTLHAEPRLGTREQARDYCKKNNEFVEQGKWIKGQGHRSDLDDVVDKLKMGTKLSEVMLEHPKTYCQYRNGLRDIAANIEKKKAAEWRDVDVTLLTGPTGCGKTRQAMNSATYKIQGCGMRWWQDYDGDDVICIDEYNNNLPIDELLVLLDGYKTRLDVKNSHTYARWTKVYITTNLKPNELHPNAKPAHRDALFRRITKIENFWPPPKRDDEVQG